MIKFTKSSLIVKCHSPCCVSVSTPPGFLSLDYRPFFLFLYFSIFGNCRLCNYQTSCVVKLSLSLPKVANKKKTNFDKWFFVCSHSSPSPTHSWSKERKKLGVGVAREHPARAEDSWYWHLGGVLGYLGWHEQRRNYWSELPPRIEDWPTNENSLFRFITNSDI